LSNSIGSSSTTTTSTSTAPGVAPAGSVTSEGQAGGQKHDLVHTDTESSSSSESDSEDEAGYGDTTFGRFVAIINADLKKAKSNLKVNKMKQADEPGCSHSIATSNSKIATSTPSDSEDEDEAETCELAFYGIRSNTSNDPHLATYMTEVWDDPFCLRGFISDRSDSDSD